MGRYEIFRKVYILEKFSSKEKLWLATTTSGLQVGILVLYREVR